MVFTLGLTGGVGSGKTTVSNYLYLCGASVVDLDVLARKLTQKGAPLTKEIQKKFKTIFNIDTCSEDGELDRELLRNYVFNNKKALTELENIIYPKLHEYTIKKLKYIKAPYAVLVIPLLIEKKFFLDKIDRILLIDCSKKTQIDRVSCRDQMEPDQVKKIIANQADREERLKVADDIIFNEDKSKKVLAQEVEEYHQLYLNLAKIKLAK